MLIATLAIALGLTCPIAARQTLDIPQPIELPELPSPSWAAQTIHELNDKVRELAAVGGTQDESGEQVRRASLHCRLIAMDLLAAADRDAAEGHIHALMAMDLMDGCPDIDSALATLSDATPDPALRESAAVFLRRFNAVASARLAEGAFGDPAKSERALQTTFEHLADLFRAIDGKAAVSHWIRAPSGLAGPIVEGVGDQSISLSPDQLQIAVENAPLTEESKSELFTVVDFLRRGEQFAELQPRVARYTRLVEDVIEFASAINNATWLKPDQRQAFQSRIEQSVRLFKDPATRQKGIEEIESSRSVCIAIERITTLARNNGNTKLLTAAFERIEAAPPSGNQILLFNAILARMLAYRELDQTNFKRDIRLVDRQVHAGYREAEEALLRTLAKTDSASFSLADPAFGSLVSDQRQHLEDLQRLRRVSEWMKAVREIDPASITRFEQQTIKMAKELIDPNRRPDAIADMAQFENQLARFGTLPFEAELKASDAAAIELTGGSHIELLAKINETRRAWAHEWSDGNSTGEAAQQLQRLFRLMRAISELAVIAHAENNAVLLNRWAAWHIDPSVLVQPASELASRLKIATASAIAAEAQSLDEQLGRIEREAPLARLVGRLTLLTTEELTGLPDGAIGAIGKLVHPPNEHAFMLKQRTELATLCRLVAEERHALEINQPQAAERIRSAVNALAEQLVRELGEDFASH